MREGIELQCQVTMLEENGEVVKGAKVKNPSVNLATLAFLGCSSISQPKAQSMQALWRPLLLLTTAQQPVATSLIKFI
jgi:hypothetical protein